MTRPLRYWLRRAYLVEIGATRMYALQSRTQRAPLAEHLAALSADEADHASALEDMMRRHSRIPGRLVTGVYHLASTVLGWCVARLGQRTILTLDHRLEVSGIAIYQHLFDALPADAAADRARVREVIAQEQSHAEALAGWLAGATAA